MKIYFVTTVMLISWFAALAEVNIECRDGNEIYPMKSESLVGGNYNETIRIPVAAKVDGIEVPCKLLDRRRWQDHFSVLCGEVKITKSIGAGGGALKTVVWYTKKGSWWTTRIEMECQSAELEADEKPARSPNADLECNPRHLSRASSEIRKRCAEMKSQVSANLEAAMNRRAFQGQKFSIIQKEILDAYCVGCHANLNPRLMPFDDVGNAHVLRGEDINGNHVERLKIFVIPGRPEQSILSKVLVKNWFQTSMPPSGFPSDKHEIFVAMINEWISDGAQVPYHY